MEFGRRVIVRGSALATALLASENFKTVLLCRQGLCMVRSVVAFDKTKRFQ